MSRSSWAVAQPCLVGAVRGAGERAGLEPPVPVARFALLGAVSVTKYLATLVAATLLVMGAASGPALAAPPSGSPAEQSAGGGLLAVGSGYSSPSGAVRVRALQRRLAGAGFPPGPIDGLFGPRTERAVAGFQDARGLPVDGIAGPATMGALEKPSVYLYPGAAYDVQGASRVRVLQRRLAGAGFPPGPIDGRFGPWTERAVAKFQAARGLPVNGIAGPRTFAALAKPNTVHRRATRPQSRSLAPGRRPARPAPARPRTQSHRPAPARQHVQNQRPVPARPHHPRRSAQPSRSPSPGEVVALALLGLMAVGAAAWSLRRSLGAERPVHAPADARDPASAEDEYRRADQRGDATAASNLGVLLERRGDPAGAEAAYRRADDRGDANGAFNLAGLLAERGNLSGAEAAYRRADDRGDAAAAANLGVLLERRGELAAAAAAFRRADERGDANGALNLGGLLADGGDIAGAVAAFSRAAERGDAIGAFNLGVLLEHQGDHRAALNAYERAQRLEHPEISDQARTRALELARRSRETAGRGSGRDA